MGRWLHVAKKYVVKYGDVEGFKYENEEVKKLLNCLECNTWGDDEWEANKDEFALAIEILKSIKENDSKGVINFGDLEIDADDVRDCCSALNEPMNEIIKMFEKFLEEADPKCEYVHFAYW